MVSISSKILYPPAHRNISINLVISDHITRIPWISLLLDAHMYRSDGDGPDLQYDPDGNPVLVGMWSKGFSCGQNNDSALFVRLGALHQFLPSEVKKTSSIDDRSPQPWRAPISVIVGGIIGGIVVLILLIMCGLWAVKDHKKSSDHSDDIGNGAGQESNMDGGATENLNAPGSKPSNFQGDDGGPEPLPLPEGWNASSTEVVSNAIVSQPVNENNGLVIPMTVGHQNVIANGLVYQPMYATGVDVPNQPNPTYIQSVVSPWLDHTDSYRETGAAPIRDDSTAANQHRLHKQGQENETMKVRRRKSEP